MPGARLQGQAPAGLPSFLGQPGSERAWLLPHLSSKEAAGCVASIIIYFFELLKWQSLVEHGAAGAAAAVPRAGSPPAPCSCLCTGIPAPKAPRAFPPGTSRASIWAERREHSPARAALSFYAGASWTWNNPHLLSPEHFPRACFAVEPLGAAGSWDRWEHP